MNKIPPDAFDFYVALGPDRSYRAVAEHYGVTKRGVAKHASSQSWPARLERIEREVRERSEEKLVESLEQMRTRHLQTVRAIQARALVGIKAHPLTTGMESVKAAELAIKLERLIVGEPSEHAHTTVEEVTRREIDSLIVPEDEDEGDAGECIEDPRTAAR